MIELVDVMYNKNLQTIFDYIIEQGIYKESLDSKNNILALELIKNDLDTYYTQEIYEKEINSEPTKPLHITLKLKEFEIVIANFLNQLNNPDKIKYLFYFLKTIDNRYVDKLNRSLNNCLEVIIQTYPMTLSTIIAYFGDNFLTYIDYKLLKYFMPDNQLENPLRHLQVYVKESIKSPFSKYELLMGNTLEISLYPTPLNPFHEKLFIDYVQYVSKQISNYNHRNRVIVSVHTTYKPLENCLFKGFLKENETDIIANMGNVITINKYIKLTHNINVDGFMAHTYKYGDVLPTNINCSEQTIKDNNFIYLPDIFVSKSPIFSTYNQKQANYYTKYIENKELFKQSIQE